MPRRSTIAAGAAAPPRAGVLVVAWLSVAMLGCSEPAGDEAASSEASDGMVAGAEPGFFVTRDGNPQGGDFGGLEGADARCGELAEAAGLPARTWRAFLSASGPIHARERIGAGPWFNVAGDLVAEDLAALMRDGVAGEAMLDEFGDTASKSPAPGVEHDILTGSNPEGELQSDEATCADWTSSARQDRSTVGHHDWHELPTGQWIQSWISVHSAPCDLEGMRVQLGAARIYCFAAD